MSAARFGALCSAFGLGVLMAQGLAPTDLYLASCVALAGSAVLFLRCESWQQAAATGWLVAFGYFGVGLRWIWEPFQVDAAAYGWMAPFALAGLAGGLALFWAVAFAAAQVLARGHWRILALIGTWSLAELARAYVLTGFPWAGLAQLVPEGGLWSWLSLVGAHGVALLLLVQCLPVALLIDRLILPAILSAAVVFVAHVFPPSPPPIGQIAMTEHVVRLVQPNAPQSEKWLVERRWDFVRRQLEFTAAPDDVSLGRADVVIWPETAIPTLQNYMGELRGDLVDALKGRTIIYGIQREEAGQYFNSAVVMDGGGDVLSIYDKMHLVPFGEYMPFPDFWQRFGIFGLASRAAGGYAPGTQQKLLDLPIGRALALICYEGVFAQDVNAPAVRADLLVLITNDAWFGSASGPQQHLRQAQMRAAEQGLPMVRAANTGISALIDPYGRVVHSLALNSAGFLDVALPAPLPEPLYRRVGDWPAFLCAICFAFIAFALNGWPRAKSMLA